MPRVTSEFLKKFAGNSVSNAVAFAFGFAAAPALEPEVQDLKNEAWTLNASKPLDAEVAAAIVAEDVERQKWGTTEAGYTGIDPDRFVALLGEALNAPGLGELFTLWRRGAITDSDFTHGLRKAKLEPRWDKPLMELKSSRYTPAQIALGVVRSVLNDPGWMVTTLDTSGSNVPHYTPVDLDPVAEAAASGYDPERMRGLVGEIGLPPSVQQLASMVFRGIITEGAYNQGVLEGDARPEWAPFWLEQARQIASASDYVNARIRGWIDDAAMYAGTARHGMSREDTHLLYLIHGRPAAPGQMATASFRGIDGPDGRPMDEAQFLKGIAESDIRPEWGPMLWESRYHYPPLFQTSRLVQAGTIDVPTAVEWTHKSGYAPEVVAALERSWSAGSSSTSREATASDLLTLYDGGKRTEPETIAALEALGYPASEAQAKVDLITARRVSSDRGKALTDLRKAVLKDGLPESEARTYAAQLGVPPWGIDQLMALWKVQLDGKFSAP